MTTNHPLNPESQSQSHRPQLFQIPPEMEAIIEGQLKNLGLHFGHTDKIAQAIHRMSDFYIQNPTAPTPWSEPWAQVAQWAYYLPLNYLRNLSVVAEAQRQNFFEGLSEVIDFGAGLGAGFRSLPSNFENYFVIEKSSLALELVKKTSPSNYFFTDKIGTALSSTNSESKSLPLHHKKTLSLFSYSLTELDQIPEWALQNEALMILEPSTQQDGRRLQEWRSDLIGNGFHIWAPCTHHQACPMLLHSKKDWCHHRLHIKKPDWLERIELKLPWRNQTLTVSYLLARKKQKTNALSANANLTRIVGDSLVEKGKTRQQICKNNQREFLSWLHKNSVAPELYRGDLVSWSPEQAEIKSNEIRLMGDLTIH